MPSITFSLTAHTPLIHFENHPKYFILNDVRVVFFSWDKKLIDIIKEEFPRFLASTNFGTRSSKGYGSFFIKDRSFYPNLIEADHKLGKKPKRKLQSAKSL